MSHLLSNCLTHVVCGFSGQQGRSRRSGWSGFGWTTISQGKSKIPFKRKQVINKSTDDFWTCSACYITIQQIEKGYDEAENNRPPTHAKIFHAAQGILLCKN